MVLLMRTAHQLVVIVEVHDATADPVLLRVNQINQCSKKNLLYYFRAWVQKSCDLAPKARKRKEPSHSVVREKKNPLLLLPLFIIRAAAKGFYRHRSRDHNRSILTDFFSAILQGTGCSRKIYQNLIIRAEIFCEKSIKSYTWFEFKQFSVVI